jgi:hypothetical protein
VRYLEGSDNTFSPAKGPSHSLQIFGSLVLPLARLVRRPPTQLNQSGPLGSAVMRPINFLLVVKYASIFDLS